MTIALEELAQRLHSLEAEVASLRQQVAGLSAGVIPAPRAAARNPAAYPAPLGSTTNDVHQQMGLSQEAPPIEKLRAMLAANGILPGDETVCQVIAGMRDQEEDP